MTNPIIIGQASSQHVPYTEDPRKKVEVSICNKNVTPAPKSIIGDCEYYYRPLHDEYVEKSGASLLDFIVAWATVWNPWDDQEVARRLLRNRDKLIQSNDYGDWSRHANFMMRHIGCGHRPPAYYVGYGYYYCSTYGAKLEPRLSDKGKKWLKSARKNLQKNMEDGLKQNMEGTRINIPCKTNSKRSVSMSWPQFELEVSSEKFKEFAFETHIPAYLDAGLVDLPYLDLWRIGTQPNIEEFADWDTWKQALTGLSEVGEHDFFLALDAVSQAVEDALDFLTRHLR